MSWARFAMAAAAGAALFAFDARAAEPLPYSLEVIVRGAQDAAPRPTELALEEAIVDRLNEKRCFEGAAAGGEEAAGCDLRVELTVGRFDEQQIHDRSLAGTLDRDRPPDSTPAFTFEIEAELTLRLLTREGALVRRDGWVQKILYRPVVHGQGRDEAQDLWVDEVARRATREVCSGSPKRRQAEIERARAAEAR